jgi:acetylornithine/succinyldiaminopimelate/putrescine aminotransferase
MAWRERLSGLIGPALREVRGRGLLIGLEFTSSERTERFCRAALAEGLILGWTLHRDTVVRLAPPLTISDHDSERALAAIARALQRSSER